MGKYDAMTVNERLFEAGLLDEFERASEAGDEKAMRAILSKVDVRRDEDGMNWSIGNADRNQPERSVR